MAQHRWFHRTLSVFLVLVAAGSQARGQQPAQPRPPERGSDLLSLQFAAVVPDGSPVTDLRPEDIKIRVGGRERTVRSLQLIALDGGGGGSHAAVPPPFGSNATSGAGRTIVVAVDENSFRPGLEGPIRQAVDALIAGLGPADRLALVTMPYGGVKVPFTTDHSRVRLAFSKVVGQAPANETGSELACRTGRTLESLVNFLERIGVREEPATMLFVTAALAAPRRDALTALAPGMCELQENLYARVAAAAGAARTHFYVIRPGDAPDRGTSVQRETAIGSDNPLAGIEHLVGVTDGKMLALTGSSGTAMDRVLRETAAYYQVTVDSQPNDYSGRSQQLDIRLARRGVELRTLPSVAFGRDSARSKLSNPSLRDMMATAQVLRDLPLRATGFPTLAAEGQNLGILVLAEPAEADVKLESLAAVLFDQDGKVAGQWVATPADLQRAPVIGTISTPPGAYRLRVAAIDATGRSGTVDHDITAEIVKSGPLKLGSLVLGLSREGKFAPKLQFTSEPLAIAYLEMEGAPAGARLNAALEIAQSVNGAALVTVPLAIETAAANRYAATGSVPLGALPPGDYIVRAMVGLEGYPMTRVVRTIRKAAPAR
jgi:hypothetical protein